jgi:hypothetical protein
MGREAEGTTHESTMLLAARHYLRGINTSGDVMFAFFKDIEESIMIALIYIQI